MSQNDGPAIIHQMFFLEVDWFPCPRLTSQVLQAFLPATSVLGVKCKKEFPSSPFSGNFYKSSLSPLSTSSPSIDYRRTDDTAADFAGNFCDLPGFCPSLRACVDDPPASSGTAIPASECLRLGFAKSCFHSAGLNSWVC